MFGITILLDSFWWHLWYRCTFITITSLTNVANYGRLKIISLLVGLRYNTQCREKRGHSILGTTLTNLDTVSYLTWSKMPFTDKEGHLTKAFQKEKHDTVGGLKMRDWNYRHHRKCRGGKCRTRIIGTKLQGWKMGALKMMDVKMTDVKLTDQCARHEIVGRENDGPTCRTWNCRTWKCRNEIAGHKREHKWRTFEAE